MRYFTLVVWTYSLLVSNELLADWPQFMNDANNSGRTTSKLEPQALGLQRQIPLGEIILTSPAIVDDRAYVVDQMGDAYCVDIETGELVWKTVSHEKDPSGGNTCSPAVVDGKVIFGTTSGHLHFLDAKTGKSLKTFDLGWPVIGSVKATKETVYVPTVDSSVHAISLNGETRWKYDHYNLAKRWTDVYDKKADGKRFEQPHFGGAPVCVIERPEGNIVVAPCGYDLVALWDKGDSVEKLWSVNQPVTEFDHPSGVSAAGNTLYCAWPKSDGMGAVAKHSLEHGQAIAIVTDQWAILNPPANDNDAIVFNRHAFGTSEIQFLTKYPEKKASKQLQWQSFGITSASVNPAISATAITKEYAVATTLKGQLLVYERNPKEEQAFRANKPLFKFQIPSGAMSTSAPAISNGKIVFGADDGCLYVIGPGESVEAKSVDLAANRELKLSDRYTEWPSAFGGDDNSGFVSNVNVKPPFRLRWAMKSYGLYKHPVCTANGELIYSSFSGIVVCRDQKTGKINWRRKLPGQAWSRATLLCADGKVFVPRLSSPRYAKIVDQEDLLYCLDQATGKLLWKNQIGRGDWLRASPVYANGVVAYGSKFETPRTSRYIVGPDQRWMIQVTDELAAAYQQTKFNSDYIRSEIANDGSIVAIRESMKELPDQYELQARFSLEQDLGANQEVGLIIGPNDKGYISITSPDQPRGRVIYDTDQGRVTPAVSSKYVGVAAKYVPIDMEFSAGKYALTMRIRKAKVKSNVSSSTSVFPPRLVVCEKGAAQGATIEAWDVNTGETRWVKTIDAKGSYIEGPVWLHRWRVVLFHWWWCRGGWPRNDNGNQTRDWQC